MQPYDLPEKRITTRRPPLGVAGPVQPVGPIKPLQTASTPAPSVLPKLNPVPQSVAADAHVPPSPVGGLPRLASAPSAIDAHIPPSPMIPTLPPLPTEVAQPLPPLTQIVRPPWQPFGYGGGLPGSLQRGPTGGASNSSTGAGGYRPVGPAQDNSLLRVDENGRITTPELQRFQTPMERRLGGLNALHDKLAGINTTPDAGLRPNWQEPHQSLRGADAAIANMHAQNQAAAALNNRNAQQFAGMGQGAGLRNQLDQQYNRVMGGATGQQVAGGPVPSAPGMPITGSADTERSMFPQYGPNTRYVGRIAPPPVRDLSGSNALSYEGRAYIPHNGGDIGTSRFVEGRPLEKSTGSPVDRYTKMPDGTDLPSGRFTAGTQVLRNPETGGLMLKGAPSEAWKNGSQDVVQAQHAKQNIPTNAEHFATARYERILNRAQKNNLDTYAVRNAAEILTQLQEDKRDRRAGLAGTTPTSNAVPVTPQTDAVKEIANAAKDTSWGRSTSGFLPGLTSSNALPNLHESLSSKWGTMTPAERKEAVDWFKSSEFAQSKDPVAQQIRLTMGLPTNSPSLDDAVSGQRKGKPPLFMAPNMVQTGPAQTAEPRVSLRPVPDWMKPPQDSTTNRSLRPLPSWLR